MIFAEKKIEEGYLYTVDDIFGKMEFKSGRKLTAKILDKLFLVIFRIKGNAKTVEGDIAGEDIKYKFVKKNQWEDITEEDLEREAELTGQPPKRSLLNRVLNFIINKIKKWEKASK